MKLITVFARRHYPQELPATIPNKPLHDVQIYRDHAAKVPFARFPWYSAKKPTRRNKYVTLNCYRWKLEWLDDAGKVDA